MPASGPVSRRSSPSRRLTSVDLPVFGRPIDRDADASAAPSAHRASGSSSCLLRALAFGRALRFRRQRGAQRVVEIGEPFAVLGGDRHRIAKPERIGLADAGLRGAAFALVRHQDRRLAGAAHQVGKGAVDRHRPGAARRSGTGSRRRRRSRPRSAPACGRLRLSGAASSRPAVSMAVKARSPRRALPSRRSRVTPGRSSTSARRLPTRRLNSVDLPTFGRPTMATE